MDLTRKPTYAELEKRVQELVKAELKRNRAEEALRQDEDKFRQLFELESDALFLINNANGRILEANRSATEIYGYSRQELLNLRNVDLSAEPERTSQATQDKLPIVPVRYHRKKDGTVFPVEITASHFEWRGCKVHIAAIRGIDWRLHIEEELRESEQRYRTLFERNLNPIAIIDKAGRYIEANPAFLEFTEKTKEQLLQMTYFDFAPPGKRHIQEMTHRLFWETGGTFEKEYFIDGKLKIQELTVSPISYRGIDAVVGVGKDITERKQSEANRKKMEEELIKRNQFIETILDNLPIGLAVNFIDEGKATYSNKKFEEIYGWPKEELEDIESFFQKVYPDPTYRKKIRKRVIEDIQSRDPARMVWEGFEATGKDGRKRIVFAKNIPLYEQNLMISTVQDITERQYLQNRLQRAQKLEAIGTLAGGIAHDFNNILSAIIGYTELALDSPEKSTTFHDNLQQVFAAGMRAKDLVKQILAFARQSEEELKPIRLDKSVREVLRFIRSSVPSTIKITQSIENDSVVMGNDTQVHQILMNLCTNAAQAMEAEGGILEVSLKNVVIDGSSQTDKMILKPGEYVEIKVSDTGAGISPDIIESIFDPYFTTKGPGEGTGMGLALVHGIVESYGGKITVDSKPGVATVFTIYLPKIKKQKEIISHEAEILPGGTEHILYVDDELPIASMGSLILESLGYAVTTRTSSVEALELFRAQPNKFDLVITDMTMPNITGDQLAAEMMKIRFDIPIILCTGYSKKITDKTASEIGIRAFAYKPIVRADLAKTVRKVLDEDRRNPEV
jgi:PAS domain S-box-containing protein